MVDWVEKEEKKEKLGNGGRRPRLLPDSARARALVAAAACCAHTHTHAQPHLMRPATGPRRARRAARAGRTRADGAAADAVLANATAGRGAALPLMATAARLRRLLSAREAAAQEARMAEWGRGAVLVILF
jgi:hypothetical protein